MATPASDPPRFVESGSTLVPDPPTDPHQRIDPPIPPTSEDVYSVVEGVDPHRAASTRPPPTVDPVNITEEAYVLCGSYTPPGSTMPDSKWSLFELPRRLLHVAFLLWLAAFIGWCASLAGLAELQNKVDDSGLPAWWAAAAYPNLAPMALFRLDWFITVFQFVALSAVLLALALDNFMQESRVSIIGYLICAAALQAIAANHFSDIASVADEQTRRTAKLSLTGYSLATIADFALLIAFGIDYY